VVGDDSAREGGSDWAEEGWAGAMESGKETAPDLLEVTVGIGLKRK